MLITSLKCFHLSILLWKCVRNLSLSLLNIASILCFDAYISLIEYDTGTTQKLPFGVNTTTEVKNITATSNNTGTLLQQNIPCYMQLLLNVVVIFLRSIVVLTPQVGNFRIVPQLHSMSIPYLLVRLLDGFIIMRSFHCS
jgi:hypothetical protein